LQFEFIIKVHFEETKKTKKNYLYCWIHCSKRNRWLCVKQIAE